MLYQKQFKVTEKRKLKKNVVAVQETRFKEWCKKIQWSSYKHISSAVGCKTGVVYSIFPL
jgi:hypothetical protein